MPEIPKWFIAVILFVACFWTFNQVITFIGKVNTTVDKANNSMTQNQESIKQVPNY